MSTQLKVEQPLNLKTALTALVSSELLAEVENYLLDCRVRGLSAKTQKIYLYELNRFAEWIAHKEPQAITSSDIRRFMAHLEDAGVTPGGRHLTHRTLKTFFRWLHAEEIIERDIFARLKPPKVTCEPLPPTELADIDKLIKAATGQNSQRDKAILMTLLDTGARAQELCDFDAADFEPGSGKLHIAHGKGGKARDTFLSQKSRREVIRYLRQSAHSTGPLFQTDEGTRLTYSGLRQIIRRLAVKAGIEAPPLHSFRRSFCVNCLRSGMDLLTLQKLMGHADLSLIQRYAKLESADLREAHAKHAPAARLK